MNLSQGGVGIRVRQPLPTGGPVRVSFALPESKRSLRVEGEVAWMDQQGNVGIRFIDSDQRTKRDLQLWLEREYFTH
jgi:Tfp pilus assembly protein PilZ